MGQVFFSGLHRQYQSGLLVSAYASLAANDFNGIQANFHVVATTDRMHVWRPMILEADHDFETDGIELFSHSFTLNLTVGFVNGWWRW